MSGFRFKDWADYESIRDEFNTDAWTTWEIRDELRALLRELDAPDWVALVDILEDRDKAAA